MTKEQYINQLKKYLHRLPKQEYEDAIDYFEEYFGEADEFVNEIKNCKSIAVTYYPEINRYQGRETLQIVIRNYITE